ncbi:MAG: ABC transporter permease [candidate division FCPU426 bacterium]
MKGFIAAFRVEVLKFRRSLAPGLSFLGLSLGPLVGGVFMIILKDPAAAKDMGLISTKASLVGTADWPSLLGLLAQVVAAGGMVMFGFLTAWMFGREFSERTVRQLLAVPTPRSAIVAAKFSLLVLWCAGLTAWVFLLGAGMGAWVGIPGFSWALLLASAGQMARTAALTIILLTFVGLFASMGRGFLAPLGWVLFSMFLAQISAVTGWGEWFPWAVAGLVSGAAGAQAAAVGWGSYVLVALASLAGLAGTLAWWQQADQIS